VLDSSGPFQPNLKASTDSGKPLWNERFSRQVILPGVGESGQRKWEESSVLLAGEGTTLQAAITAFSTTGLNKILVLNSEDSQGAFSTFQAAGRQMQILPPGWDALPETSLALVLTENPATRREANRAFRAKGRKAIFGWAAGSGFALFASDYAKGCPCLECFEVLNPKAFSKGTSVVQRMVGAAAASETLQWILTGQTALLNQVWITSLETGVSLKHEVHETYKCPALLMAEGIAITP